MVYDEGEGRPIQLVTIARYRDLSEGIVARAALESAGIECFLRDENFVRLDWGYSNCIGGMRLQVDVADEEEAMRLLKQATPEEIDVPGQPPFAKPICPRCGSDREIAYDAGLKPAAMALLLMNFLSAFLLWPLMLWRVLTKQPKQKSVESWHCLNCGCNWAEEDAMRVR